MKNPSLSGVLCLMLAPTAALAGCTASAPPAQTRTSVPAQPRMATYRCAEGAVIRIESVGGMVRVYPPLEAEKGTDSLAAEPAHVELAAAPPGQQSRYGADGYALVLEGREALWMDAGKPPLTCMR